MVIFKDGRGLTVTSEYVSPDYIRRDNVILLQSGNKRGDHSLYRVKDYSKIQDGLVVSVEAIGKTTIVGVE